MKVKESEFIKQKKAVLRELIRRLAGQYPYVSVLAADSRSKAYGVSRRNTSVGENGLLSARGFVAKVSDGQRYAEYSFNRISENALDDICARIAETVSLSEKVLPEGIGENVYQFSESGHVSSGDMLSGNGQAVSHEEAQAADSGASSRGMEDPAFSADFSASTEYETDPEEMGDDVILERLTRIKDRGLAVSGRILDCSVRCNYQKYTKLFLAWEEGRLQEMEQSVMWMTGGISLAAPRGEEIKDYYKSYSGLGGAEVLDQMEDGVEECARITLELLDSETMIPGEYDCICTPEVTGMIVHEAFGHGVEMDMFVKKRAQAQAYIGKYVASELVTMHDGASAADQTATYFFDDEGTLAHDTVVIEKGILKQGISDLQSARILGTEPTGNGRRESYKRKAYTRMTNTYFEGGTHTKEEMIASVSYGFLLENASSGMEDPKNWGIQCMVNIAREIRDGKLTGRIFSPIVLTGYVPDLLKSISMMSEKVELGGGGFCGKGYKEWVKVSDGGPYIKARIRLG